MSLIREMVESDIVHVSKIIFEFKREKKPEYPESQRQNIQNALFESLTIPFSKVYVYVNNNMVISGYIATHLIPFPIGAGMELYISDLVVSSRERGEGIGQQLIAEAEDRAKEHKCERMMLLNSKESEAYARKFYKKQGFLERANFANFVKNL